MFSILSGARWLIPVPKIFTMPKRDNRRKSKSKSASPPVEIDKQRRSDIDDSNVDHETITRWVTLADQMLGTERKRKKA